MLYLYPVKRPEGMGEYPFKKFFILLPILTVPTVMLSKDK